MPAAGHTDSVSAVAFSRDGKLVAVGGMDGRVNVWDVETGELSASLEGPDEVVVGGGSAPSPTSGPCQAQTVGCQRPSRLPAGP